MMPHRADEKVLRQGGIIDHASTINEHALKLREGSDDEGSCVLLETSGGPLGTVAGVFQFPVAGLCSHVALPANATLAQQHRKAAIPKNLLCNLDQVVVFIVREGDFPQPAMRAMKGKLDATFPVVTLPPPGGGRQSNERCGLRRQHNEKMGWQKPSPWPGPGPPRFCDEFSGRHT